MRAISDDAPDEAELPADKAPGGVLDDRLWTPGAIIGEDYRVERLLGQGGMGVVVAARHVASGELVAIKLIRPERAGDRAFIKRFLREARIAARLKSERVARVLRSGELPSGLPYMVMEYLEGGTVESLLRAGGPLPIELAVDYLLQVCEAVAEAHALGVVHRDLKPANLFVARARDVGTSIKVIDFGISKWMGDEPQPSDESRLTTTATLLGSPRYMSPEQLSVAGSADPRTDIWALGIILFEMLTAAHPFEAESVAAMYASILRDPAPAIRSLRAAVPAGLDAVYRQCCVKEGASRMASVGDLAVALAPFGSAGARLSVERIVGTALGAATTAVIEPPPMPIPVGRGRRVGRIAALVGGMCAAGALYAGRAHLGRKAVEPPVRVAAAAATPVPSPSPSSSASSSLSPSLPLRSPPLVPVREVGAGPAVAASPPAPRAHRHRSAPRGSGNGSGTADRSSGAPASPRTAPAALPDEDLFTTRR